MAFTRAVDNLYVISNRGQSASRRARLIEQTLPKVVASLEGATLEGEEDKDSKLIFRYGKRYVANAVAENNANGKTDGNADSKTENVLKKPSKPVIVEVEEYDTQVEFRQSNKSREFISGDDDTESNGYLKLGCILHNVFSKIRTSDDVDGVLLQLEQDGLLYDEKFNKERIVSLLRKRLTHPKVAEWFATGNTLYNECTIL